ncbi:hypothetical protein BDR03DRAFT_944242 [Suillus americanus]|nr:hypothetical protein BDR03DRAFT_944242 [Suillus americanus]
MNSKSPEEQQGIPALCSINGTRSLTSVYVTPLPPALTEFNWHTLVRDILPAEWHLMNNWASNKANLKAILSRLRVWLSSPRLLIRTGIR